jgi:Domain of unknown function (DUF1330)
MPTYIVGDIQITDPAAYQAHIPHALATIARFGGRVVAGGGSRVDLLEGDHSRNRSSSSNFRPPTRPDAGISPMTIRRRWKPGSQRRTVEYS